MKKIAKQTTTYLLVAVLVFSAFAGLCFVNETPVDAAGYPTGYPNTYKNTGIGATDIVGVARTQIGYQENYVGTKYGDWYNGYFVNQPWCAMFVSWCANQAKISTDVVTKFAACNVGVSWFKSQNRWYDSKYYGGTYTPKKGDIVFYSDYATQSNSTHVGILAGLNGNYLDVIEGNTTNESVCEHTTSPARTLTSSYVIGYGHPNYSTAPVSEPTTYEVWQVSVGTLNMRKSASATSTQVTTVPFGKEIKVTEVKVTDSYIWGYSKYGTKKGWVALDYCDYIFGSINGAYYQLKPTVSPAKKTLYVGYSKTLTSTNGLGGKYSSSDKTIAKVSSKGKITALKKGTVNITLKTNTGKATCKVTVKNPTFNTSAPTACIGDSYTLTVEHTKLAPTAWSSADKTIAKVNSKGKVTALKKGVTDITATVGDVQISCPFTVTKSPKIYENFKTTKDTYLKETYTEPMKSLVKLPKGTVLKIDKFYYSDTLTFGAATYGGKTGWVILNKCSFVNGSINGKHYLVKPYLKETSKSLYVRDTYELSLTSPGKTVAYTSVDSKTAKVSSSGKITALAAGKTKINIKSNGFTIPFSVSVKNPKISAKKISLLKGNKQILTVTGGSGTITWSSTDKKVATVNSKGEVTAKGYGTATITAVRNGVPLPCEIAVYDPVLNATSKVVRVKQTKTLKVLQSSGAAVKWTSADKTIAKVNSKGEVTGVAIGKTYVTAEVDGVILRCDIRIAKEKAAS